jgi:L-fuconolactonase
MATRFPNEIIDPHIHQWDPFTTPRHVAREARLLRRVRRVPRFVRWLTPRADREFVGHPHYVLKPYLPEDYRADAAPLPVSTVVHIEASWPLDRHSDAVHETKWVAALPFGQDGAPKLGAVIVHADPRLADVGSVLDDHLAASPLVRGVRCSAANHPDPGVRDFCDAPHMLRDPGFVRGFAAIAERGLSFELWLHAHQLPDAIELVREYPETTFVLDHYATPVGIFGRRGKETGRTPQDRARLLARWRDDVSTLAEFPNVRAKHSGLGMPMLGGVPARPLTTDTVGQVVDRCAPLVRHLHDAFGSDRVMWASNFPIDKPVHTIGASIAIITEILGSDADPDKLLRDVAARTYRIT